MKGMKILLAACLSVLFMAANAQVPTASKTAKDSSYKAPGKSKNEGNSKDSGVSKANAVQQERSHLRTIIYKKEAENSQNQGEIRKKYTHPQTKFDEAGYLEEEGQ